jgi:hypothetical protein
MLVLVLYNGGFIMLVLVLYCSTDTGTSVVLVLRGSTSAGWLELVQVRELVQCYGFCCAEVVVQMR